MIPRLFMMLTLLGILSGPLYAQQRGIQISYKAREAADAPVAGTVNLYPKSYALIIGNDLYNNGWSRLSNGVKDAQEVAKALKGVGFDVTLKTNLKRRDFRSTIEDWIFEYGGDKDARLFIWYAGHGHTDSIGEGYLVPVDAPSPSKGEFQFKRYALNMRDFGTWVRTAQSKHVYAVFDSCFAGTVFNSARAAPPPAITLATTKPVRQFLTSGDADQTVSDDGTFRELFIDALKGERRADANGDGYLTASELGMFMGDQITNLTNGAQTPRHGKLRDKRFNRGDFVFAQLGTPTYTPAPTAAPRAVVTTPAAIPAGPSEEMVLEVQKGLNEMGYRVAENGQLDVRTVAEIKKFEETNSLPVAGFVDSLFLTDFRKALADYRSGPKVGSIFKDCDICPEMVVVPAGSFMMGSSKGGADEKPVHRVTISEPFAVGRFEVTFNQWDDCVADGGCGGYRPKDEGWGRGNRPVVNVSWDDAQTYVQWLSRKTGSTYRLLSEAEWEYVARAGSTSRYHFGDAERDLCEYANGADQSTDRDWRNKTCKDGYGEQTAPVGQFKPNAFGLYDVHGNVWEWVQDCYNDSYNGAPSDGSAWQRGDCGRRGVRGGSWLYGSDHLRSDSRGWFTSSRGYVDYGFRVAKTLKANKINQKVGGAVELEQETELSRLSEITQRRLEIMGFDFEETAKGLWISAIAPNSKASEFNIPANAYLLRVGNLNVTSAEQFINALPPYKGRVTAILLMFENGNKLWMSVGVPPDFP